MSTTLCLDVGSTAIKAAVIDQRSSVLHFISKPLPHSATLAVLKDCFFTIIRELTRKITGPIDAIALCGNGPSLVVNPQGESGYCIYWYDQKRGYTGFDSYYLPLFLQIPESSRASIHSLMALPEYLCSLLGGDAKTVLPSNAYERYILSYDEQKRHKLPKSFLRRFHPLHQAIGQLSPEASRTLHIPAATPIFCGGTDYLMNILGVANLTAGDSVIRMGTRTVCNCIINKKAAKLPLQDFVVLPYIVEQLHTLAVFLPRSIDALVHLLMTEMQQREYRSLLEYSIASVKRTITSFSNDDGILNTVARTFTQQLLIRYKLELLESRAGIRLKDFYLSGEQHHSDRYAQVCADFLGRKLIKEPCTETALVGLQRLVHLREAIYDVHPEKKAAPYTKKLSISIYPEKSIRTIITRFYNAVKPKLAKAFDIEEQKLSS